MRLSVERPADLVTRAQAGDRGAFDGLYAEHVGHVYALCLRMTADVERAESLTQDAFVRAWHALASFRGQSAFSSWMHRLTVNVVLEDERRTRRRERRVFTVEEVEQHDTPDAIVDPDARMDLERAIASLPDGARNVLVLYDIEGYRQDDIACMLGIAVGTVKAQLHRARRLLRGRLS
jgi:RNA polymerase sigma-70 factor (ECF subfamily)